jgi:hypothetical protein
MCSPRLCVTGGKIGNGRGAGNKKRPRPGSRGRSKPAGVRNYTRPWSSMALATLMNPAMLAPLT